MKRKLWNNIRLELKDNIFNKEVLRKFINNFYGEILKNISEDQHILFIFRIELENSDIKTTSKMLKINNESDKASVTRKRVAKLVLIFTIIINYQLLLKLKIMEVYYRRLEILVLSHSKRI